MVAFDKKKGDLRHFFIFNLKKYKSMKLSIVLSDNYRLLSLAAILDVFETTNQFLKEDDIPFTFDIQLVGIKPSSSVPFPQHSYTTIYEVVATDMIVIPAFSDKDMPLNIEKNLAFIPWLHEMHMKGSSIMSVCTGAFLLAASGLLNKRYATTHIDAKDAFSNSFPDVKLIPHAVVTQSDNIYTSGGATSSFHLILLIVEQYCGREIALRVAKTFAIDMDRNNQLYFEYFKPELSNDELVRQLQIIFNTNYRQLKSVEEAVSEIPSSPRNILRRFKQTTGLTPIKYLQKTKIEAAKNLLSTTQKDILEVMLLSGYQDLKNFRTLFKSFTGLTPKAYRDKFGIVDN